MNTDFFQHTTRGLKKRWGIMIACNDHNVPAGRSHELTQKIVIQLLSRNAWCRAVKDVSCNQQHIDFVKLETIHEPSQKKIKLIIPFVTAESAAQMPVRGMEQSNHRAKSFAVLKQSLTLA
jgi:hypothetical protein